MIGAPELLMTVFMVVAPVVSLYFAYWVIRLAVRHGMEDVYDRQALGRDPTDRISSRDGDRLSDPMNGTVG